MILTHAQDASHRREKDQGTGLFDGKQRGLRSACLCLPCLYHHRFCTRVVLCIVSTAEHHPASLHLFIAPRFRCAVPGSFGASPDVMMSKTMFSPFANSFRGDSAVSLCRGGVSSLVGYQVVG